MCKDVIMLSNEIKENIELIICFVNFILYTRFWFFSGSLLYARTSHKQRKLEYTWTRLVSNTIKFDCKPVYSLSNILLGFNIASKMERSSKMSPNP